MPRISDPGTALRWRRLKPTLRDRFQWHRHSCLCAVAKPQSSDLGFRATSHSVNAREQAEACDRQACPTKTNPTPQTFRRIANTQHLATCGTGLPAGRQAGMPVLPKRESNVHFESNCTTRRFDRPHRRRGQSKHAPPWFRPPRLAHRRIPSFGVNPSAPFGANNEQLPDRLQSALRRIVQQF